MCHGASGFPKAEKNPVIVQARELPPYYMLAVPETDSRWFVMPVSGLSRSVSHPLAAPAHAAG
jgi:hypothetical protein